MKRGNYILDIRILRYLADTGQGLIKAKENEFPCLINDMKDDLLNRPLFMLKNELIP